MDFRQTHRLLGTSFSQRTRSALQSRSRRQHHQRDLRLTRDDLQVISNALPENRAQLSALRVEIREKVFFRSVTLQDVQRHQHLFDRNEVFSLLGDRYLLDSDQVEEGAQILARWRAHPAEADALNLQQTVELLASLLGVESGDAMPVAISA